MRLRRTGATLVLAAVAALGMPGAQAAPTATLVAGITYLPSELDRTEMTALAAVAPPAVASGEAVLTAERYAARQSATGYLVVDFMRTRTDLVVRGFAVDTVTGAVEVLAEQRGPAAAADSGPGDVTTCVRQTTVHVPGKEDCLRQVQLASFAADLICLNPFSRLPVLFGDSGCDVARRAVEEKRKFCEGLPEVVSIAEVCQTVSPPSTGVGPVDDNREQAVERGKDEYCKHRSPCEVS